MGLLNIFRNKKSEEVKIEDNEMPLFDKKFKIVLKCNYDHSYMEKVEWLNSNSKGAVDVKILATSLPPKMFIAFEDDSDALIFKIKYQ